MCYKKRRKQPLHSETLFDFPKLLPNTMYTYRTDTDPKPGCPQEIEVLEHPQSDFSPDPTIPVIDLVSTDDEEERVNSRPASSLLNREIHSDRSLHSSEDEECKNNNESLTVYPYLETVASVSQDWQMNICIKSQSEQPQAPEAYQLPKLDSRLFHCSSEDKLKLETEVPFTIMPVTSCFSFSRGNDFPSSSDLCDIVRDSGRRKQKSCGAFTSLSHTQPSEVHLQNSTVYTPVDELVILEDDDKTSHTIPPPALTPAPTLRFGGHNSVVPCSSTSSMPVLRPRPDLLQSGSGYNPWSGPGKEKQLSSRNTQVAMEIILDDDEDEQPGCKGLHGTSASGTQVSDTNTTNSFSLLQCCMLQV